MFYFPYSFWLRNVCRANSLQKQTLESWPHELTNNNNKKKNVEQIVTNLESLTEIQTNQLSLIIILPVGIRHDLQ